jgi:hypothetical protein
MSSQRHSDSNPTTPRAEGVYIPHRWDDGQTDQGSTTRTLPLAAGPSGGFAAATGHSPARQPPPPSLVAAAERDYHAMQNTLSHLVRKVQALRAEGFTDLEAVTDVWLTLRAGDDLAATFLGATAIMQIANNDHPGRQPRPGRD